MNHSVSMWAMVMNVSFTAINVTLETSRFFSTILYNATLTSLFLTSHILLIIINLDLVLVNTCT
jgi:hypothetical protein